jgi:hypothetical protein
MKAMIAGICISANDVVTYRCIWYHAGGGRKNDWLRAYEIQGEGTKAKIQIGFNGNGKTNG